MSRFHAAFVWLTVALLASGGVAEARIRRLGRPMTKATPPKERPADGPGDPVPPSARSDGARPFNVEVALGGEPKSGDLSLQAQVSLATYALKPQVAVSVGMASRARDVAGAFSEATLEIGFVGGDESVLEYGVALQAGVRDALGGGLFLNAAHNRVWRDKWLTSLDLRVGPTLGLTVAGDSRLAATFAGSSGFGRQTKSEAQLLFGLGSELKPTDQATGYEFFIGPEVSGNWKLPQGDLSAAFALAFEPAGERPFAPGLALSMSFGFDVGRPSQN